MKKYIVTIEEILSKDIEIYANSREEAEDIVTEGYDNGDYVLSADHHEDTTFTTREAIL
ncbi:DpnD/PcfM family protein [Bengtsoniella intestinalis]|uniref:DpnD/PcfM family protein n=1 Tax=Bengtsoniella intestinalis TaxID=3073143 RepID=UPI00391F92B6